MRNFILKVIFKYKAIYKFFTVERSLNNHSDRFCASKTLEILPQKLGQNT